MLFAQDPKIISFAGGLPFVPGNAFYVDRGGNNTMRLNFSNSDEEKIEEGIERLAFFFLHEPFNEERYLKALRERP